MIRNTVSCEEKTIKDIIDRFVITLLDQTNNKKDTMNIDYMYELYNRYIFCEFGPNRDKFLLTKEIYIDKIKEILPYYINNLTGSKSELIFSGIKLKCNYKDTLYMIRSLRLIRENSIYGIFGTEGR